MPIHFSRRLRLVPVLLLLAACARAPRPSAGPAAAANKYDDDALRDIGTAQDERSASALTPFLASASPVHRREAALALASVQARAAVPALLPVLRDADPGVRRAAAYALGQTADSLAVDSLRVRVLREPDPGVRRYAQEALGRCVTRHSLPELWRVPVLNDTARATAQAWGLARAALHGLSSPEAIRHTVLLFNEFKLSNAGRLAAATALARTPRAFDADLARLGGAALLRVVAQDKYYAVRAAAATAGGRLANPAPAAAGGPASPAAALPGAPDAVRRAAARDVDYRVRVVALRGLPAGPGEYGKSRAVVFAGLADKREPVALTAAEWLLAHARGETGDALAAEAAKHDAWRVRATLLATALKVASPASRPSIAGAIEKRYGTAPSVYEKGYLLQALGEDAASFDFLQREAFAAGQSPVVGGYALAALVAARRQPGFPAGRQADFAAALRRALAGGDVAQLGTAAETLADAKLTPDPGLADLDALRQAQAKLQLPRDVEAWQGLQQALDKLTRAPQPTPTPVGQARQHPIDWALVREIPANQRVKISTTQGDIELELRVNEAPGSVASFVALVRQHFYDGLYFHRVVPDFVAQGGDPRGDGSGSTDYTLRSEFGDLRYQEGSVGLASAGKDTESCQWFITHTPTPHLDGRYTIFAQVVGGMAVVHHLEIGDKILRVELMAAQ
ncbi:peptidylprolyl isomerase [Hymenobacter caeli]|uniref:peptidylprolyl isomerase n=1 Tax=Hymenobacter caeli TaxID=2735894 RepID=UPI00363CE3B0